MVFYTKLLILTPLNRIVWQTSTFLDVAPTILTSMQVPKTIWGHVVLIACFLEIACPPGFYIGISLTPVSILIGPWPLLHVTPRVFGVFAFSTFPSQVMIIYLLGLLNVYS